MGRINPQEVVVRVAKAIALGRMQRSRLGRLIAGYSLEEQERVLERLWSGGTPQDEEQRQAYLSDAEAAIRTLAGMSLGCPMCHRRGDYTADPSLTFCDKHYGLYLATNQHKTRSVSAHRAKVLAALLSPQTPSDSEPSEAEPEGWTPLA